MKRFFDAELESFRSHILQMGERAIDQTRLAMQALAGRPLTVYEDGRQLRDFVYVGDCAAANLLALDGGAGLDTIDAGAGNDSVLNNGSIVVLAQAEALEGVLAEVAGLAARLRVTHIIGAGVSGIAAAPELAQRHRHGRLGVIRARVCAPSSLLLSRRHAVIYGEAVQAFRERWNALEEPEQS